MTKLTPIEELAAAASPTGEAIVVGVKGPEGEHHGIMHVDAARRFVHVLLNAIEQAEANAAGSEHEALKGPLMPLSEWTIMPNQPDPQQLVLQLQGGSLVTNYPLAPEDARSLAKGLWAGADRTDGGVEAVQ